MPFDLYTVRTQCAVKCTVSFLITIQSKSSGGVVADSKSCNKYFAKCFLLVVFCACFSVVSWHKLSHVGILMQLIRWNVCICLFVKTVYVIQPQHRRDVVGTHDKYKVYKKVMVIGDSLSRVTNCSMISAHPSAPLYFYSLLFLKAWW